MMISQQLALAEREVGNFGTQECWKSASREDFVRMEAGIRARVLPLSASTEGERIPLRYAGRTFYAVPLDTARFVRAMARHISMN